MKNFFLILFAFFSLIVFSQEKSLINLNDLKLGTYKSKTVNTDGVDQKSSFDIYVSKPSTKDIFNIYIDVSLKKRDSKGYSGSGLMLTSEQLDLFFNNLMSSKKQFEALLNRENMDKEIRFSIGRNFPCGFYQWKADSPRGPLNRQGETKKNSQKQPLSIDFVASKNSKELWITIRSLKSVDQEFGIVFDSVDDINTFLKVIDPNEVRQKVHNNFKIRGKK